MARLDFEAQVLSQTKVYTVRVPKGMKWEPGKALSLTEQLLTAFRGKLTFRIIAEGGQVRWQILDMRVRVKPETMIRAIQAVYPRAEIDVADYEHPGLKQPIFRGLQLYQFANPFFCPLKTVADLGAVDPLSVLVQAMSNLRPGERIVYTLHVGGFTDDVTRKWGREQIRQSTISPLQLLTMGGLVDAVNKSLAGATSTDKYVADQQKLFNQKVDYDLLFDSYLLVQADRLDWDTLPSLLDTLAAIILQFRTDLNALVPLEEDEGADLWELITPADEEQTSTIGVIGAWAERRDKRWRKARAVATGKELATLWHMPHEGFTSPAIAFSSAHRVPAPASLSSHSQGVLLGYNRVANRTIRVHLADDDRDSHMSIVGKTKVGKSTLMHRLIHQDIEAGRGVAVIDPHGSLVRDVLRCSIPVGRLRDVVVLDVADEEHPPPLNPLAVPKGVEHRNAAGRLLAVLDRVYGGLAGTPRLADTLTSALTTLWLEQPATVRDVVRLFDDEDYRHRLLRKLDDVVAEEFWAWFERQSAGQRDQLAYPVIYRMRAFYANRTLYPMMCHPEALDFTALIEQGKILLVSLHTDDDKVPPREQKLLGAVLVAQLQMAATRAKARSSPFYLYIDEAQHFVTTALDEMLSEARKFGLSLVLANQYLSQLTGPTLDAVLGNVGSSVIFQVGPDDARALAPYVKPDFNVDDLVNLDLHRAAVKMQLHRVTLPAFSLETLPPIEKPPKASGREEFIRKASRRLHVTKTRQEVLDWLNTRYPRPGFAPPAKEFDWGDDPWVVPDDEL